MKKQIIPFEVIHVISEPGDWTRYDYVVVRNDTVFNFVAYYSTFCFPSKLDYWDIQNIEDLEGCQEFIKEHENFDHINPHTMLECIRTIKELYNNER